MQIANDHFILDLLKRTDPTGYRALFDKYYKTLCLQAYFLLQNEAEAEDLVQDIFVKFWEERKFEVIQQSLGAYLSMMVKNAALNILKQKSRLTQQERDYEAHITRVAQADVLELQEMTARVQRVIGELPEQCRLVFELICVEGKKYQEAADIVGVTLNTVKTQLRRAFTKLRENLKDYTFFMAGLSPVLYVLLS